MQPVYWLIVVAVLLVLEILTLGLTTIWFAGGAFVAFLAGMCQAPLWIQIILFLAVSIVLLIFTRPIVEKHLNNNREKTNVDSLVGKHGKVMLNGMEWTARSVSQEGKIPVETKVEVMEIKGAHLVVQEWR